MSEYEESPHDRRAMFRLGFKKLVGPIAEYLEDRLNVTLPIDRELLRPPGALPEREFMDTCYRCGNCVDVCPAKAIRPVRAEDIDRSGSPYIDADLAACVVCGDLACMKACPSGALKLVAEAKDIRMGLARVDQSICLRSQGKDCQLCLDKCPFGSEAVQLAEDGTVQVQPTGCVGCGVCQFYCPTTPKAVVVEPQ